MGEITSGIYSTLSNDISDTTCDGPFGSHSVLKCKTVPPTSWGLDAWGRCGSTLGAMEWLYAGGIIRALSITSSVFSHRASQVYRVILIFRSNAPFPDRSPYTRCNVVKYP
jgi:hypothetical protein